LKKKEKIKKVRDHIVPILVDRARLEMMDTYKPGMVEPVGDATVGVFMSTEPIRSIEGPFLKKDFYACYKILIPLKPVVPLKDPSAREILQEHVQTMIQAMKGELPRTDPGETLIIYWTDYWVTKEGEVWHEESEGLWRKVLQLPEGLLQASLINLRATLHAKYVV